MLKTRLKGLLLAALGRLTGRHPLLLPAEAAAEGGILHLKAPYRIEGGHLEVELLEEGGGEIRAQLLAYEGHFPRRLLWDGRARPYRGPCRLRLRLEDGRVELAGEPWGQAPLPLPGRRLAWDLALDRPGGRRRRLTGHYLPGEGGPTDAAYFTGDNYVDHEAESAGNAAEILSLLRQHGGEGPVLELGCATGAVLAALEAAGVEAWGLDFSPWAVEQARERLGAARAFLCDLNHQPLPGEVVRRGPFSTLVLWAVLEHFRHPFAVLEQLAAHAASGSLLLIHTTNAASLTRRLFGRDWEGYFDPTHLGVETVSAETLAQRLPQLGWEVLHLGTHRLWASNADPTAATLREWYAGDARFRRLLAERDLGDFVRVVARRQGGSR